MFKEGKTFSDHDVERCCWNKLVTGYWFADVISQQQMNIKKGEKKPKEKMGKLWAVNNENDNLKHDTRQILSFCSK